jgi:hypothetical protein
LVFRAFHRETEVTLIKEVRSVDRREIGHSSRSVNIQPELIPLLQCGNPLCESGLSNLRICALLIGYPD